METDAKQIGSLLTDLPQPSTEASPKSIVLSMTAAEVAAIRETAALPIPSLQICDDKHFKQCFRILDSALPRRSADDASGELMMAAYKRKLGHLSKSAVIFLVDQALDRCHWFPTIAECLEIVATWERDDQEYLRIMNARGRVQLHIQQDMEAAMTRLSTEQMKPDEIASLPDQWLRIADARGLIRWDNGRYIQRPRTC